MGDAGTGLVEVGGRAGSAPTGSERSVGRRRRASIGVLAVALVLVAACGDGNSSSSRTDDPLGAAVGRVREEGSYRFRSEVTQVAAPAASVTSGGRSASTQSLVLEGVTDVDAAATELSVSVDGAGRTLGLRVVDGVAYQRLGEGGWVESAGATADQVASAGDLMGSLSAARDVVDAGTRSDGGRVVTRYVFGIDPAAFSAVAAGQLQLAGRSAGVPVGVTGSGELWVDAGGLPVRQLLTLTFPASGAGVTSTQISVEFSDFGTAVVPGVAPSPSPTWWSRVDLTVGVLAVAFLVLVALAVIVAVSAGSRRRGWSVVRTRSVSMLLVVALVTPTLVSGPAEAMSGAESSPASAASVLSSLVADATTASGLAAHSVGDAPTFERGPSAGPHQDRMGTLGAPSIVSPDVLGDPADTTTDSDSDGLTDFVEERIGTDAELADTDADGVVDTVEVDGFTVPCAASTDAPVTWFGDPENPDSNADGVADGSEWGVDSDEDCTPDLFDDDNDGDGVPDRVDTSPSTVLGATVPFGATHPLELTVDGLDTSADLTTLVEFQLRPSDERQLRYAPRPDGTQSRLDWPADTDGQIMDLNDGVDDKDVTLVPVLEVTVPAAHALPSAADLEAFGVRVDDAAPDGTRKAYVPLTVVRDPVSGDDVALAGRMVYSSQADWSDAQAVKLLWLVQVNNDVPCDLAAADATAAGCTDVGDPDVGYIYDSPQIVQAYYEPWALTGLTVTEEHGTDVATIYEDPAVDDDIADHQPTWGLDQVLTERFLATAPGTDTFEITTGNIARLIDRDQNGGTTLHGLPDVFQVRVDSYRTFDEAIVRTSNDVLPAVLDDVFTPRLGGAPFMPSITTAYASSSRSFDLGAGSGYVDVADNAVTMSFSPNALSGVPLQTLGGVKWSPYCATGGQAAWALCGADTVIADVDRQSTDEPVYDPDSDLLDNADDDLHGDVPVDQILVTEPAPELAEGERQLALLHALTMMTGRFVTMRIATDDGVVALHQSYALSESISYGFARSGQIGAARGYKMLTGRAYQKTLADLGNQLQRKTPGSKRYHRARYALEQFTAPQRVVDSIAGRSLRGRLTASLSSLSTAKKVGIGGLALVANLGLALTGPVVDALDDEAADKRSVAGSLVKAGLVGSSLFAAAQATSEVVAVAEALGQVGRVKNLLGASSAKYLGQSVRGSAIGAAVFATITWGFFVYQMASAGVTAFSPAFDAVLAETIAETLYVGLLTALSLTVVGNLVVALILLVDALINFVCDLTDEQDCATVSSSVADAITVVLYGSSPMIDVDASDLVSVKAPTVTLEDPELGYVAGNSATISVPVETTVTHTPPDAWQMAFYTWMYSPTNIRSADFEYRLSAPDASAPPAATGPGSWDSVTVARTWQGKNLYRATRKEVVDIDAADVVTFETAGLNQSFPYTLNAAYTLPTYECWTAPGPPPVIFVPVCYVRTLDDTTSSDMPPLVYDILPATLAAFLSTTSTPDGTKLAWDPAFEPLPDVDGDGLLAARDGGLDPDDATADTDGDGLSDRRELELRAEGRGVSPTSADVDGDGVSDLDEVALGTDPTVADTDNDGLADGVEARHVVVVDGVSRMAGGWDISVAGRTVRVYSDPLAQDSDSDGISDRAERTLAASTDPADRIDDASRPYHPGVANTAPIAIAISVPGSSGFVAAGDTVDVSTDVTAGVALAPSVLDLTSDQQLLAPPALLDFDVATFVDSQVRQQTAPFVVPTGHDTVTIDAGVRAWLPPTGAPVTSIETRTGAAQLPVAWFSGLYPRASDSTNEFVIAATLPATNPVVRMNPLATGERTTIGGEGFFGTGESASACNDEGTCLALWIDPSQDRISSRTVSATGATLSDVFDVVDSPDEHSYSDVTVVSDGNGFEAAWWDGEATYVGLDATNRQRLASLGNPFGDGERPRLLWAGGRLVVIRQHITPTPNSDEILAYDTATGRQIVLGEFNTPDTARFAYDAAADAVLVVGNAPGVATGTGGVSPIVGVLWPRFAEALTCTTACTPPTTATLFGADQYNDGAVNPDVSFDPVSKQWVVGVTQFFTYGTTRTPSQLRYFGRSDLAGGVTWTEPDQVSAGADGLSRYRNVACPAASALPVVELGFEELPGATRFADSARPGQSAGTYDVFTSPQAGAPAAPGATGSHLAARFVGTSDVLLVDTPSVFRDPTPVSLAFWVRLDPSTSPEPFSMAWDASRRLRIRPDTGAVTWRWGAKSVQSSTTVNDGRWHFVVATHSATTLSLSVDGAATTTSSVGSETSDGVPENMDVSGGGSPVTVDQLQFYDVALGTKATADLATGVAPQCLMLVRNADQSAGDSTWTGFVSRPSDPRGASLSASSSLTLRVDGIAPTATVVLPSAPIGAGTYVLAGNAADGLGGSGVSKVEVQVDGGDWATAAGAESWVLPLDLGDGEHRLVTRVTDGVGNSAVIGPDVVRVDLTAPSVTLDPLAPAVRPDNDGTTGEQTLTVTGSASDAMSGLAGGRVEVHVASAGTGIAPDAWQPATVVDGRWSIDYVLSPADRDRSGPYTVLVRAVDVVGNETASDAASTTVVLDSTAPAVTMSESTLASPVLAGGAVLTGDVTDDGGVGVGSVDVSLTPVESVLDPSFDPRSRVWLAAQVATASWSLTVPAGVEGHFQIDVRSRDVLGNEQIVDRVWSGIIDTRAPRLGLTIRPTGSARPAARRYEIAFSCSAHDLFLDASTFTCPGRTTGPVVHGFLDPSSPLSAALATLFPDQPVLTDLSSTYSRWENSRSPDVTVRACDLFGNCASSTGAVGAVVDAEQERSAPSTARGTTVSDVTPPVAVVVSPTAGGHVAVDGTIDVGIAAEATSSIKTVDLYLDEVLVATRSFANGETDRHEEIIPATLTTGGLHTVSVSVEDWVGGTARSAPTQFFSDLTSPSVTFDSSTITLDQAWAVGTDFLRFSGSVVDDGTIAAVQLKVGDGRWTDASFGNGRWSTAVQVPGADGSTLPIAVRATDLAGRTTTIGQPFEVDLTPSAGAPYVRPDSAIATGPTSDSGATATFGFVGTAGDGAVAAFSCRLDALPAALCDTPFTLSDLASGSHTLTVAAIDDSGYADLSPATWTWSVAVDGPQAIISSGPDATTDRRTATFEFGLSGATFECALDAGTFTSCASPATYTGLADGAHTFSVRAVRDGATGTAVRVGWRVVNNAPVAVDQRTVVNPLDDAGRSVTLVAGDVDPVSYRIVEPPLHGFLEGTPPNVDYVPFSDYVGPDRFTFEATDGQLVSGTGTVTVDVQKVTATLAYTGSSGVATGTITLSGAVSPVACPSSSIVYTVNGTVAAAGSYPITAGNLYEIEMSYSDSSCEAPSVYAVVLADSTADASNGGGQYEAPGAGTINFGYTVQVGRTRTGARRVSGQMLWNSQNGKFRFVGIVTGFVETPVCPSGSVCGHIVGTGTLQTRNESGEWVVTGSALSYRVAVVDGGPASACTAGPRPTCTTLIAPDAFGLDILGAVVVGEQPAPVGGWPTPVQLSGGSVYIDSSTLPAVT